MPNKPSRDKPTAKTPPPGRATRSRGGAKPVSQALDLLLQRQPALAARAGQQEEKQRLTETVRAALPPELAPHMRSASLERTELLITADGAVWSGRLRYALAAILPELQQKWPEIGRITLRVGKS